MTETGASRDAVLPPEEEGLDWAIGTPEMTVPVGGTTVVGSAMIETVPFPAFPGNETATGVGTLAPDGGSEGVMVTVPDGCTAANLLA